MGSLVGGVIGNVIAPGIGGQIGSALGGSFSKNRASKRAQTDVNREAELAYKRSLPVGVTGMFGNVSFDEEGRMLDISADPRLTAEADLALEDVQRQREYLSELEGDPMSAAANYLAMQRQLMAPKQAEDRLALEERLLAQGMLGSTGGANRQQALAEAQAQQDLQAQYGAIDKAQSMIDTYRARQAEGLGTFESIGELPFKYAQLSRGIGSDLGSAAETSAKMKSNAAQAMAQSKANLADIGSGIFKDTVSQPGMFDFSGDTYGGNWFDTTKLGDMATTFDFYNPFN